MIDGIPSVNSRAGSPPWPRRLIVIGLIGWTIFVGIALYVLFQEKEGHSVLIVYDEDPLLQGPHEKVRALFRVETGFQRVYPWVLFSPYIAWIAFYFCLERGRLRFTLPLNLAACLAFMAASHAVTYRISRTQGNVLVIRSGAGEGSAETNIMREKFVLPNTNSSSEGSASVQLPSGARIIAEKFHPALTNLFPFPPGFRHPIPSEHSRLSPWSSLLDLLAYGAVAGLAHSIHFYRRLREREHRTLVLESNLANARLNALRAQLHPHFLFNSLNAIAALLRRNPAEAENTLVALSELLRLALSQSDRQETSLREELQFVDRYWEIQRTRFGDALDIEQDVEPAALDCAVPTLLLQPVIENALRHGIEPAGHPGQVRLTAKRDNAQLILTVEDNGVGLVASSSPSAGHISRTTVSGIGLTNLRARLETLYGTSHKLELIPRSGGGLIVRIQIPCRLPKPFPQSSPTQQC